MSHATECMMDNTTTNQCTMKCITIYNIKIIYWYLLTAGCHSKNLAIIGLC